MTGIAIRLKLCMTFDYFTWHNQLFYVHCVDGSAAQQLQQGKHGKFRPHELGQFADHHSIHMHREYMHAGGQHEQDKERHMHYMPKSKQAFE